MLKLREISSNSILFILLLLSFSSISSRAATHVFTIIFVLSFLILTLWQYFNKNIIFFKLRKIGPDIPIAIFFISVLISNIFIESAFIYKLRNIFDCLWLFLLYGSIFCMDKLSEKQVKNGIKIFAFACIILSIASIAQLIFSTNIIRPLFVGRISGFFSNPVPFANTIAIPICLFMSLMFSKSNKNIKTIIFITLILLLFTLLFTYSRGAWIGTFFGLLSILYLHLEKKKFVLYAFSTVLILFILFNSVPKLRNRLLAMGTDYSSTVRINLWRSHYDIFKENPIFGVGLFPRHKEKFYKIYKKNGIKDRHIEYTAPHSNIFKMLSSVGLVGFLPYLILFIYFLFYCLKHLFRTKQLNDFQGSIIRASIGAQISFHISGLTATTYNEITTRTLLVLSLAMALSLIYKANHLDKLKTPV